MKEIVLTQGKVALVDDEDFEFLNQFKWYAHKQKYTFYAVRNETNPDSKKRKTIKMHRFLLRVTKPKTFVDHKDHNGLNNQKHNLRESTHAQNQMNRNCYEGFKYKGVSYIKLNKWRARIKFNQKQIHLGYFTDEIQCAKAYDIKAKELFGEFANLNFPD